MHERLFSFADAEILIGEKITDQDLERLLSEEELAWAQHDFSHAERRLEWSRGRACLKRLLEKSWGISPRSFSILADKHHRPILHPLLSIDGKPLHISISHSDDVFMAAVSRQGTVGADIQTRRRKINGQGFLKIFHESELKHLQDLGLAPDGEGALLLWCFKEAYLKSSGGTDFMAIKKTELQIYSDDGGYRIGQVVQGSHLVRFSRALLEAEYGWAVVVCGFL